MNKSFLGSRRTRSELFVLAALVVGSLALTGCKSEIEKYADDVCACKDKKCVDELDKAMEEKHKGEDKAQLLKNMSGKDLAALGKASECEDKLK